MQILIALLLWPLLALAGPVRAPHVTAELVSEYISVKPGEVFWVGLRLEMEPEWHTYWQFPGDSGLATKVKWELPAGWKISEAYWPTPERILIPPLVNFGFSGETLIGFRVTVPENASAEPASLKAKASWLVCKEECVPGSADLGLSVKIGAEEKSSWNHFDKLRREQPKPLPAGAFLSTKVEGERIGLEFKNDPSWLEGKTDFFPLVSQVITGFDPPQVEKTAKSVVLWMEKSKPFSATARALSGVLVVGEERYAVNASLGEGPPASTESPGILFAVALAFLGGVILNLMPCVFPVLGIKVMALVAQGNGDRWHSRKHGKVYVLGVLVSFWLLTALLLLLRRAGESVGWGFQLQHPAFVIVMIFLFSLLSANLAGFVEFGGRLMGVGSGLASREGYSGSFFSGVLAVVVATPCTAPFMGTAISVVLGEPAWAVFSVFTALALGLGLPFLFLSYQPSLLRRMPRPGAWMERLKEFFAFPLAATVIWLFWVLALQVGNDGLLLVALSLLSLFGAIWAWKRFRGAIGKGAGWALLLGAALLAWAGSSRRPLPSAQAAGLWQPFSPEKVEAERAKGKAVFIDFTAAWCLTCQVNKALVLDRPGMQEFFRSRGIALFLADWTNSDPRITKALEGYGRIGVPVYVAYPAGSDRAKVLPQLLTEELVKHAFP